MDATESTAGSGAPGLQAGFHFADAVISRSRSLGHCFCLGLDPHLAMIPAAFRRGSMDARDPETAAAVEDFLTAVIDIAAPEVAAVKPQSAMYERLGAAGIAVLERVVAHAHERGVIVVLDAKRGDIGSTAEAYAEAYLAPDSPNPVECLTVNPYMGVDTLEPYLKFCRERRPRHPGARQDQQSRLGRLPEPARPATARSMAASRWRWRRLPRRSPGRKPAGRRWASWSAPPIRRRRPISARSCRNSLFLLPGFGFQGGDPKQFTAALGPAPAGREGGLISSSRATLFPPEAADGSFDAWKSAFTETLRRHIATVADSLKP